MNPGRLAALLAALIGLAALLPGEASGIPVFARKYGFNCTMCHSSYPRLNDFGARYRANGYRLPGRENVEKTVFASPTPLAVRTNVGYTFEEYLNVPADSTITKVNTVELGGLDVLSSGLLGPKLGYFLVFVPGIPEGHGVAGQDAALEMASVVFSDIAEQPLSLRAGRFEPAYVAFSVKRQLSASPYEVFEYSFPGGPRFSDTQTGLELRAGRYGPLRAVAGLASGSETNRSDDPPKDGYLRVETVLGRGEGQTSGQRFGLVGYLGCARPDADADSKSFARVGADASLNAAGWNLALQYLWARDDGALWGQTEDTDWWGGFAELTFTSGYDVTAFARAERVTEPSFIDQDIQRLTAGARYHFEDNVAGHVELSRQQIATNAADDPTGNFATARLDFAF